MHTPVLLISICGNMNIAYGIPGTEVLKPRICSDVIHGDYIISERHQFGEARKIVLTAFF